MLIFTIAISFEIKAGKITKDKFVNIKDNEEYKSILVSSRTLMDNRQFYIKEFDSNYYYNFKAEYRFFKFIEYYVRTRIFDMRLFKENMETIRNTVDTDEALEILKAKKKGNYCVIEIDPSYEPAPIERKDVFGITFEQGRNELHIDDDFFSNIVTENKELTEQAKIDLAISMITLKYTQSNSVCYVKGGQAIGIGAGQQSRIHCTRLAGSKADNWWLRQSPQVLGLQFVDGIRRADRDNTIDLYIGEDYMDVLAEGEWQKFFKVKPDVFTAEEKRAWLDRNTDVALGSDAFFPFGDNIERAHKSGVKYVAQPGGSVRDDHVIDTCNKYGMVMSFTGIRLFHH